MPVGVPTQFEVRPNTFRATWSFFVTLAKITAAGDVITQFTPGFPGSIMKVYWVQATAVTTAAKAATINLEINAVNLTGGSLALTSAACTPIGKYIAATAITGNNNFDANDTISVEASSVTAFVEGQGTLYVEYEGKIIN